MVKIVKTEVLIEDVSITVKADPAKGINEDFTYTARSGTDGKIGKPVGVTVERLSCGHQNNLTLTGRTSGVCPKGC